jgi:hypothetical protein
VIYALTTQHEIEDPLIGASRRLALRELRGSHAETRPDATNPGDSSGEATPVPIPNTEVKLSSAEDTERAAFRENRSSPGFLRLRAVRPRLSRVTLTRSGTPAGILFA